MPFAKFPGKTDEKATFCKFFGWWGAGVRNGGENGLFPEDFKSENGPFRASYTWRQLPLSECLNFDSSLVTGKSLDSPENGNVDKMPEKCRKNVRKISKTCPEGLKTQFSNIFWTIFAYLVDAFVC